MKKIKISAVILFALIAFVRLAESGEDNGSLADSANGESYIFSYFRGRGRDGLHLAYSRDGLNWTALKGGKSFLKPKVGRKLMRDPCTVRGPNGVFHMVWTTGWPDKGIGLAHSKDLVNWSDQEFLPLMRHEPGARNCWAPEIIWDPAGEQYVIYWSTTIEGKFKETAGSADNRLNHRVYCTTTKDFENYTKTRLFYDPGFNVIDSTIVPYRDGYVMISKNETRYPPEKNLHTAVGDEITGPWREVSQPFTPKGIWVEGPTVLKVGDFWYVYYDAYRAKRYGAMRTRDFERWEDVSDELKVPRGMRHGTALAVPDRIIEKLLKVE